VKKKIRTLDSKLQKKHVLNRDIVLFGAGQLGQMAIDLWPSELPRPICFFDQNAEAIKSINGIPVYSLKDAYEFDPTKILLLVAAFKLPGKELSSLVSSFNKGQIITVYDLFEIYCPEVFSNGWTVSDPNGTLQKRGEEIAKHLADRKSRLVYQSAISWRINRKLEDDDTLEPEDLKYHYDKFAITVFDLISIIDCGGYDLSYPKKELARGQNLIQVDVFEPDEKNHIKCVENLAHFGCIPINLHREALSDKCGVQKFISNGLLSARLTSEGYTDGDCKDVTLTTLDKCFMDPESAAKVDDNSQLVIKIHVEGAELAVLKGAQKLIQAQSPILLINISHNMENLFDVPEFLISMKKYKLFIRAHSLFGEGITLTAIPRSRYTPSQ
jgi:FkbM family methyltransferase